MALRVGLMAVAIGFCNLSFAADGGGMAAPAAPAAASRISGPAVFRGTLGTDQVQVQLRPKEMFEDSIEGDYFLFGRSLKVLLAGDVEGGQVFLEESENGTDISGQWEGVLAAGSFSGKWSSADGTASKPFALKMLHPEPKSGRQNVRN